MAQINQYRGDLDKIVDIYISIYIFFLSSLGAYGAQNGFEI